MTRRAEVVDARVVHAMATANRSDVSASTWVSASAGVSAPSSITLNPAQRSRSAAMATGAECRSAGGVVMTTLPRLGPRRANRAPMREMSRTATALARCSSATVSSPTCQRSPMDSSAGATKLEEYLGGRTIRGQGGLEHAPGAGFVAGKQPGLELGFGRGGSGGRVAG